MESHFEFNKVYNLDCIEGIKIIPSKSIDLVITDPPFGIDFKAKRENYNRKSSRVLEGYNEIKGSDYYKFTCDWMNETKRVLKDSGSMYIFSGWNYLKDILNALVAVVSKMEKRKYIGFEIVKEYFDFITMNDWKKMLTG